MCRVHCTLLGYSSAVSNFLLLVSKRTFCSPQSSRPLSQARPTVSVAQGSNFYTSCRQLGKGYYPVISWIIPLNEKANVYLWMLTLRVQQPHTLTQTFLFSRARCCQKQRFADHHNVFCKGQRGAASLSVCGAECGPFFVYDEPRCTKVI